MLWIAVTLMAAGESPGASSLRGTPERQLLVKCEGGSAGEPARAADLEVGAVRVRDFHALGWHVVGLPDGLSVAEAMARYRARSGVLAVEPNAAVAVEPPAAANGESRMANGGDEPEPREEPDLVKPRPHSPFAITDSPSVGVIPNDPRFREQWNLRILGMTNAWAVTTGSSNVIVAVVDTGVDYNHEDLRENMWRNPGETGLDALGRDKESNGIDDDGNGYIDDLHGIDATDGDSVPLPGASDAPHGHGTGSAGILGAAGSNGVGVAGINWSVRIMALRSDNPTRRGVELSANALACYDYVLLMKRRGTNVRVTNNPYALLVESIAIRDAMDALGREGILVVCSAGNQTMNSDAYSTWPRSFDLPFIVSVAASTEADTLADYSNYGRSTVDLAAPAPVPTTARWAAKYVSDFAGTSAACPHVSGAAALLLSIKPDATPLELKAALMQSVDTKPAFQGKMASHGRLNVARALEVITNTSLPAVVVGAFPASSRSRPDAPVELWFNKPMDRATVETALRFSPGISGALEWSDGDRVLRLRHEEPLLRTNYTCRLLGSARDASGTSLDGNFNRAAEGSPVDDFVWGFGFGPANDEPSSATRIGEREGSIAGTTRNADPETDEPMANGYLFNPLSVWYTWIAPQTGWTTFEVSPATGTDLVVEAFSGSGLADLKRVAFNDNDGSSRRPRLSWLARSGEAYLIDVAGKVAIDGGTIASGSGDFTLAWYTTPPASVSSFNPSSGRWGESVTIEGTHFTGATRVLFNGIEARFTTLTNTHAFHDRRLTAVVPTGAESGPITLETPHGNGTSTSVFEVIEGPPALVAVLDADRMLGLSWPATATGYILESTRALGIPAWAPADVAIDLVGTRNTVRIVPAGEGRFYRLRKP